MKKAKRLGALAMALALGGTVLLAGCGTSDSETTESTASAATQEGASATATEDDGAWHPTEKVTIQFGEGCELDRDKNAVKKIIEEYNKVQPNVEVEFVEIPWENMQTWLTMQLTGGMAPDVFLSRLPWANEDYKKGFVRDLAYLYDEKSPYSDAETYGDSFAPAVLSQIPNGDGVMPAVCNFVTVTKVYYNKAMFEKAGITEIPSTWGEFMDIQQKLLDSGVVPFAFPNSKPADNLYNWCERLLTYQVVEDILPELDVNGSGIIENNEMCRGIDMDLIKIDSDPYQTVFPLLKDWSQYWSQGYNSTDLNTAEQMFLRQDAAMFFGFPTTAQSMEEMGVDFEYGTFTFPMLTKEDNPYACEKVYEMGGNVAEVYCIPTATEGEELKAAEDFLMFLSSKTAMKITAEERFKMPTAAEPVSDALSGWIPQGELVKLNLYGPAIDQKFSDDSVMFGQLYMEGSISLEEYVQEMQASLKDMCERIKATNGWSADNNYGLDAAE